MNRVTFGLLPLVAGLILASQMPAYAQWSNGLVTQLDAEVQNLDSGVSGDVSYSNDFQDWPGSASSTSRVNVDGFDTIQNPQVSITATYRYESTWIGGGTTPTSAVVAVDAGISGSAQSSNSAYVFCNVNGDITIGGGISAPGGPDEAEFDRSLDPQGYVDKSMDVDNGKVVINFGLKSLAQATLAPNPSPYVTANDYYSYIGNVDSHTVSHCQLTNVKNE